MRDQPTLRAKIVALRGAGFPIRYVYRSEVRWEYPPGGPSREVTELREPHGGTVWCSDGRDRPAGYPCRAYADLSRVGKGECQAGQSSTLDRSNFRSLIRDYPGMFTPTAWSNVDGLGAYAGNLTAEVIGILAGLADQYPVYDDEDMSELESDEITESFDQYARADAESDMDEQTRDLWDQLALTSDSAQEALWWQVCSDNQGNDYCEHDGYSANWDLSRFLPALSGALAAFFSAPEPIPGQGVLPVMTS